MRWIATPKLEPELPQMTGAPFAVRRSSPAPRMGNRGGGGSGRRRPGEPLEVVTGPVVGVQDDRVGVVARAMSAGQVLAQLAHVRPPGVSTRPPSQRNGGATVSFTDASSWTLSRRWLDDRVVRRPAG